MEIPIVLLCFIGLSVRGGPVSRKDSEVFAKEGYIAYNNPSLWKCNENFITRHEMTCLDSANNQKDESEYEVNTTVIYYTYTWNMDVAENNIAKCHDWCVSEEFCMSFTYHFEWEYEHLTAVRRKICNLRRYPCAPRNLWRKPWTDNSPTSYDRSRRMQTTYCEKIAPKLPGYWPPSRQSCTNDDIYRYARRLAADIPECAKACRGDYECLGFYYYHWKESPAVLIAQACALLTNLCPPDNINHLGSYYLFYEKIVETPSSFLDNFELIDFVSPLSITVTEDKDEELDQERIEKCAQLCLRPTNATKGPCKGFFWAADPNLSGDSNYPQYVPSRCVRMYDVLSPEDWIPNTAFVYYIQKNVSFFVIHQHQRCIFYAETDVADPKPAVPGLSTTECKRRASLNAAVVAIQYQRDSPTATTGLCAFFHDKFPCNWMHALELNVTKPSWQTMSGIHTYVRNDIEIRLMIIQPVKSSQPEYDVYYSENCAYPASTRTDHLLPGPHTEAQCAQRCTDDENCQTFWWCNASSCSSNDIQCYHGNTFCTPLYPSKQWNVYVTRVQVDGFTTHYATTCTSPLEFTQERPTRPPRLAHLVNLTTEGPSSLVLQKTASASVDLCAEECRKSPTCRSFFYTMTVGAALPCQIWSRVCHKLAMSASTDKHYFVRNYLGTKSDHFMADY